jgi:hypothetical protein
MHGGTNPLARALGRGTRQFYRLARSGGNGQIAAVPVSLRTMARPASDYPNDVTVYLVEEDFGRLGRAYLGTDAAEADRETIIRNFISGQYESPGRVVAFNTAGRAGRRRAVSVDRPSGLPVQAPGL